MTTEEALEASIAHWRENELADDPMVVKLGPSECALCNLARTQFRNAARAERRFLEGLRKK